MHILVCEDDPDTREVLGVTLRNRGHSVDAAETAEKAVELFDKSPKKYDLIIMDVSMPGDSGFWLAGHARGKGYDGRIAAYTGKEFEAVKSGLSTVKAEYWPKPSGYDNLVERVEGNAVASAFPERRENRRGQD